MDLRDAVDAQLAFMRMELHPAVFPPADLIGKGTRRVLNAVNHARIWSDACPAVVETCCLGCGVPTSMVSWPDAGASLPPLVEADSERLNRFVVHLPP